MALAKPILRNMLVSKLKKGAVGATVVSVICVTAYLFLVKRKRQQQYADFYRSYDAEADFERMKKAGVFRCVTPSGEIRPLD